MAAAKKKAATKKPRKRVPRVRLAAQKAKELLADLDTKLGRPADFTPDLITYILRRIACGHTVTAICKDLNIDRGSVYTHMESNPEFKHNYALAQRAQCTSWADDMLDISDNQSLVQNEKGGFDNAYVQVARLRTDNRKWLISKLNRSVFGDHQQIEHTGKDGTPLLFQPAGVDSTSKIGIDTGAE